MNYYLWSKQTRKKEFNFSYGSKIHGNFIALQNQVSAFVKIIDSRTRELAEFFNIPNSYDTPFDENKENLYDLYLKINYDKFNNRFSHHYDAFKNFLNKYNIPNVLDENDEFKEYLAKLTYYDYRTDIAVSIQKKDLIKRLPKKKFKFNLATNGICFIKIYIYKILHLLGRGKQKEKYYTKYLKHKRKQE